MLRRWWKPLVFFAVILGIAILIEWPEIRGGTSDEDDRDDRAPVASMVATAEAAAPQQAAGKELTYNFDSDVKGKLPTHFHSALTGQGAQPQWVVQADASAPSKPNVLAQTSGGKTDYRFPLAIADEVAFRDLDIDVRFKAVSGDVDRAAGLVFRFKDANNYYVVRANALENNYNLYHVVNGQRREITGTSVKVAPGEWHQLRVEAVGNKITCYYDGDKKIETTDETFKDAGKIGLWTKADSVTYFDDLHVVAK
jgi:cytochrome c oxidase assembly protein Cox11